MNSYTTPPPPFTDSPESPLHWRRRRRRTRRVIIGTEYGRWYEYRADTKREIHCRQSARVVAQSIPRPAVSPIQRKETAGAILALGFLGVFSGLLAIMVLIMELL